MSAAVCPDCGIGFPCTMVRCDVCGARLEHDLRRNEDPDWKERVNRLLTRGNVSETAVDAWRLHELLRLGLAREDAENLARRRDVDVERVRWLVRQGCPADTAVRIVA